MPNYITTSLKKLKPLFTSKKRFLIEQGGMRSGKTYPTMMLIVSWCQTNANKIWSVAGISYPHLAKGAIRDFQTIMKNAGIWEPERWNGSSKQYTFSNETILEFISVDTMDAHGPARDGLFVNEANDMDWETFDQLASRTGDKIVIDYNPTAEFWAHTELLAKKPERCDFIVLTYKDNEALNPNIREYIEDHKPKPGEKPSNWWLVYGLGQIGSLEDNIYHGWIKATEAPEDVKLVRYGLDFGYNDPTAMVAIYEGPDGDLFIRELLYESELNSDEYAAVMEELEIDPTVLIVADSARPEIINAIAKAGYLIIPADKNAGSVVRGIDEVQQRHITYDGKNLEREYMSYAWRKTRTGKVLEVPQDGEDHALDALRYAVDDMSREHFDF
jgi:phage terminase large subunit